MTPATRLTNQFLVRCGELWPDTVRLLRTGVGAGVGMSSVRQAVAYLESGMIEPALRLLRRPVKFGDPGQPDLTGWVIRNFNGERIPQYCGVEIKASGDAVSKVQSEYHNFLREFGAIFFVVRTLEQGIEEMQKYAGPPCR